MKNLLLSLLGIVVILSGCGYAMRSTLPADIKTIYIYPFENKINYITEERTQTYFPLLEVKVRNAVADRFLFDGRLKVAAEVDTSNLILKGALLSYQKNALRYTDNDDVQEYRVNVTVSLEIVNTKTQEVVWAEPSFTGEATYYLQGSQARSEEAAVSDAIEDLAKRVVERTIEDW